jgi:maltose O-acetyltransferase
MIPLPDMMPSRYPYRPSDPTLSAERLHARKLIRTFNDSPVEDGAGRKVILKQLLNPNSADDIFIEPPFRLDYGYNLTMGKYVSALDSSSFQHVCLYFVSMYQLTNIHMDSNNRSRL